MDRWMGGWMGEGCAGLSAGPGCKASRDSLGCWGAHHPGIGRAGRGCLRSPELAPSPPRSLRAPRVPQAPTAEPQHGQAGGGCRAHGRCLLPGASQPIPDTAWGAAGSHPRAPGASRAPVMPGQGVASLWGQGDGRGEGGWLGHRCCHRSGRRAGFQPPRTLFIRLSVPAPPGGPGKCPTVPRAGSALRPWQCLLLLALGVQQSPAPGEVGQCCSPHFTDGETEAQSREGARWSGSGAQDLPRAHRPLPDTG